jgi:arylsulfatase A-like enzyme
MTGRIPIRSALSIVVAPADENYLRKETPTIAEFFQKNGYTTYFSGKWPLGDKPVSYPIEHGFDEMKNFAAYYAGFYTYDYTNMLEPDHATPRQGANAAGATQT